VTSELALAWSIGLVLLIASVAGAAERGSVRMDRLQGATWRFGGVLGERIQANVEHWLLVAPRNNPGLLDMFANRDRGPKPDLVPWAGEFVGKYLVSGVQALRMSGDPRLREMLQAVVNRLLELQAEDGYLGPWPKNERLLGYWDLWGHYHVMLGLMLWHEHTGDEKALAACRRMADLICRTYLDTSRRVFDAGSHEMNMSTIHGLALLYRRTGEPRYLRMAEEILKDFERAGDYFRTGLTGVEFFRTPRPRWESLHAVQGLAELYLITGDVRFRQSFLHHWASIRRFDMRNTGGFSSGEQATGNPFADAPIETCCVVAWQAVMIDALRLTGDPTIADDLELATFNAIAGAQHPSGAWCTYDTPMNGRRVPSHVAINFQARPGAPHLNCCSVNGPRGFGCLSEWGLMRTPDGLAVHFYGPMQATLSLTDGTPLTLEQETTYPIGDEVTLTFESTVAQDSSSRGLPRPREGKQGSPSGAMAGLPSRVFSDGGKSTVGQADRGTKTFTLALRIPAWSKSTRVAVNGDAVEARAGSCVDLRREWKAGDRVTLRFDMALRYAAGDLDQFGRASLYRGPILLAHDERFAPGTLDVAKLDQARLVPLSATERNQPWLLLDVPTADGKTIRLCDFASAGATGGSYRSWLPATGLRPPAPVPWLPADGSRVAPGAIRFTFRKPAPAARTERRHTVVIADSASFEHVLLSFGDAAMPPLILPAEEAKKLQPNTTYFWKLIARNVVRPREGEAPAEPLQKPEDGSAGASPSHSNGSGHTESIPPHNHFSIDPSLPPAPDVPDTPYGERPKDKAITLAPLRGDVKPEWGQLKDARGWKPAAGPDGKPNGAIELDGQAGRIVYGLEEFPDRDFTVALWVSVTALPKTQYGQVFSAWCRGMDDPLRLVVHNGKLHARIEAGQFLGTDGWPVELGKWVHVAAVKEGPKLTLYIGGQPRASARVPESVASSAEDFALGGNPHYGGPEFLAVRLADLRFYGKALSPIDVGRMVVPRAGD